MQEDEDPASANSPQKKKKDEKPIEKEFVPDPAESPRKKKKKPSEKDSVSATEDRSKETKDEKTIDEEKTPKKKNRKQESRDKDSVSAKDKEDSTGFAVQREPKKQDKKDSTSVEEDGRRKKKEEAKSGDQVPGRKVEGGSRPSQERVAVAEDDKKKKKKRIVQSEDDMSAKAASSSSRKQSRRNRAEEAVSLKRGDGDHALPAGASEAEIQALSSDLKKQESLEELSKGQKDLGSFRAGRFQICDPCKQNIVKLISYLHLTILELVTGSEASLGSARAFSFGRAGCGFLAVLGSKIGEARRRRTPGKLVAGAMHADCCALYPVLFCSYLICCSFRFRSQSGGTKGSSQAAQGGG